MEIKTLTTQQIYFDTLKKNTVFYSKSGKPLSRVELYQSGANRIIRMSDMAFTDEIPERQKNDIREFSHGSRRRYFYYINSLDLSSMNSIFFLTFTISTHLHDYIDKDGIKKTYESIFNKLKILEFDFVYKIEYTLGCSYEKEFRSLTGRTCADLCFRCPYSLEKTPMPHLHILIYSKNHHGFQMEADRIKKAHEFSVLWTDSVYDNHNLGVARFYIDNLDDTYNKMCVTSCELQIPQDLKKLIFYFADYTSKNKDYQNTIPERFWGSRTWGRRSAVYKDLKKDPIYIELTQKQFDDFYRCIVIQWETDKKKKCATKKKKCATCKTVDTCKLYKKNGFYHAAPLAVLNGLLSSGKLQNKLTEDEFFSQIDEQFKKNMKNPVIF